MTVDDRPCCATTTPRAASIDWCPNRGANIKPCGKTLKVEVGYSTFVRLVGRQGVVLANLDGKTDGTPPGVVHYRSATPSSASSW